MGMNLVGLITAKATLHKIPIILNRTSNYHKEIFFGLMIEFCWKKDVDVWRRNCFAGIS
jgi:hypothetical protein